MSFFKLFSQYDDAWQAIIRPPRHDYCLSDLGPREFSINRHHIKRLDFNLENKRGLRVECSWFQQVDSQEPIPCIIYCHANGCSRVESVQYMSHVLGNNMHYLSFDFSGQGSSEGMYSSLGWFEQDDLELIINYLLDSKKVSKIAVWGRSMGAATAIFQAAKDPRIACVVLDSTFRNFVDLAKEIVAQKSSLPGFVVSGALSFLKDTIKEKADFDIEKINPIEIVPNLMIPALFGAANDDKLVNPQHTKDLYENYGGPKQLYTFSGDHNCMRPKNWNKTVIQFLQTHLQLAKSKTPNKKGINCSKTTGMGILDEDRTSNINPKIPQLVNCYKNLGTVNLVDEAQEKEHPENKDGIYTWVNKKPPKRQPDYSKIQQRKTEGTTQVLITNFEKAQQLDPSESVMEEQLSVQYGNVSPSGYDTSVMPNRLIKVTKALRGGNNNQPAPVRLSAAAILNQSELIENEFIISDMQQPKLVNASDKKQFADISTEDDPKENVEFEHINDERDGIQQKQVLENINNPYDSSSQQKTPRESSYLNDFLAHIEKQKTLQTQSLTEQTQLKTEELENKGKEAISLQPECLTTTQNFIQHSFGIDQTIPTLPIQEVVEEKSISNTIPEFENFDTIPPNQAINVHRQSINGEYQTTEVKQSAGENLSSQNDLDNFSKQNSHIDEESEQQLLSKDEVLVKHSKENTFSISEAPKIHLSDSPPISKTQLSSRREYNQPQNSERAVSADLLAKPKQSKVRHTVDLKSHSQKYYQPFTFSHLKKKPNQNISNADTLNVIQNPNNYQQMPQRNLFDAFKDEKIESNKQINQQYNQSRNTQTSSNYNTNDKINMVIATSVQDFQEMLKRGSLFSNQQQNLSSARAHTQESGRNSSARQLEDIKRYSLQSQQQKTNHLKQLKFQTYQKPRDLYQVPKNTQASSNDYQISNRSQYNNQQLESVSAKQITTLSADQTQDFLYSDNGTSVINFDDLKSTKNLTETGKSNNNIHENTLQSDQYSDLAKDNHSEFAQTPRYSANIKSKAMVPTIPNWPFEKHQRQDTVSSRDSYLTKDLKIDEIINTKNSEGIQDISKGTNEAVNNQKSPQIRKNYVLPEKSKSPNLVEKQSFKLDLGKISDQNKKLDLASLLSSPTAMMGKFSKSQQQKGSQDRTTTPVSINESNKIKTGNQDKGGQSSTTYSSTYSNNYANYKPQYSEYKNNTNSYGSINKENALQQNFTGNFKKNEYAFKSIVQKNSNTSSHGRGFYELRGSLNSKGDQYKN